MCLYYELMTIRNNQNNKTFVAYLENIQYKTQHNSSHNQHTHLFIQVGVIVQQAHAFIAAFSVRIELHGVHITIRGQLIAVQEGP